MVPRSRGRGYSWPSTAPCQYVGRGGVTATKTDPSIFLTGLAYVEKRAVLPQSPGKLKPVQKKNYIFILNLLTANNKSRQIIFGPNFSIIESPKLTPQHPDFSFSSPFRSFRFRGNILKYHTSNTRISHNIKARTRF